MKKCLGSEDPTCPLVCLRGTGHFTCLLLWASHKHVPVRGSNMPEVSLLVQRRTQTCPHTSCRPHWIPPLCSQLPAVIPAPSPPRPTPSTTRPAHFPLNFLPSHLRLPFLHPPPSPRLSTGVLPRGHRAMPRSLLIVTTWEEVHYWCLVGRGQGRC